MVVARRSWISHETLAPRVATAGDRGPSAPPPPSLPLFLLLLAADGGRRRAKPGQRRGPFSPSSSGGGAEHSGSVGARLWASGAAAWRRDCAGGGVEATWFCAQGQGRRFTAASELGRRLVPSVGVVELLPVDGMAARWSCRGWRRQRWSELRVAAVGSDLGQAGLDLGCALVDPWSYRAAWRKARRQRGGATAACRPTSTAMPPLSCPCRSQVVVRLAVLPSPFAGSGRVVEWWWRMVRGCGWDRDPPGVLPPQPLLRSELASFILPVGARLGLGP